MYRRYIEKDAALERRLQPVYVSEPSVDATISIIRGLKIKYESHHGVRIADGAVVAAARLSDRYITSRFLPDKAIDLLDEACAVVRVELDSEPAVLDSVKRRRFQLQVEAAALRAEEGLDALSTERLVAVKAELQELQREQVNLEQGYEEAKAVLGQLADTRRAPQICPLNSVATFSLVMIRCVAVVGEIEDTQWAIEENERKLRVEKAADLRYGELPQLQQRYQVRIQLLGSGAMSSLRQNIWVVQVLEEKLKGLGSLVADSVGAVQVAEIVSRWTGIPVTRLTRSEAERMLGLKDRLSARVIGQPEATAAVASAVIRARAGLSTGARPVGSFLFLGPTGVGKTELAKALATELFDDEKQIVRLDMSEVCKSPSVREAPARRLMVVIIRLLFYSTSSSTPFRASSDRHQAMLVMTTVGSSLRQCVVGRGLWFCSTRWKKPTRPFGTLCCSYWTRAD